MICSQLENGALCMTFDQATLWGNRKFSKFFVALANRSRPWPAFRYSKRAAVIVIDHEFKARS